MKSNLAKKIDNSLEKKVKYEEKDSYIEGSFAPDKVKVRVNMFLDGDTVLEVRAMAEKVGSKYQTLLNKLLRNAVFGEKTQMEQINERLGKLEKYLK